ncbi:hypothetical protein TRVL_06307 [Trypanosoma vivax]|nr:hypothetical protein TRVL_06307 [Trypanosoma vivax]
MAALSAQRRGSARPSQRSWSRTEQGATPQQKRRTWQRREKQAEGAHPRFGRRRCPKDTRGTQDFRQRVRPMQATKRADTCQSRNIKSAQKKHSAVTLPLARKRVLGQKSLGGKQRRKREKSMTGEGTKEQKTQRDTEHEADTQRTRHGRREGRRVLVEA